MRTTINQETIKVEVPYALKDNFKSFFKTAKWNSISRTWDVKNTTANKNRLEQFQDLVIQSDVQKAQEDFDQVEATAEEITALENALAVIKERIDASKTQLGEEKKLALALASVNTVLTNATADLAVAKRELEATRKSNRDTLSEILSQYDLEGKSVQEVVKAAGYLTGKWGRDNKEAFNHYTIWLGEIFSEIHSKTGIAFHVLYECGKANFNRPDRDSHWFKEDVLEARFIEVNKN